MQLLRGAARPKEAGARGESHAAPDGVASKFRRIHKESDGEKEKQKVGPVNKFVKDAYEKKNINDINQRQ
jgi:hypothetical protein